MLTYEPPLSIQQFAIVEPGSLVQIGRQIGIRGTDPGNSNFLLCVDENRQFRFRQYEDSTPTLVFEKYVLRPNLESVDDAIAFGGTATTQLLLIERKPKFVLHVSPTSQRLFDLESGKLESPRVNFSWGFKDWTIGVWVHQREFKEMLRATAEK